MIKIKRFYVKCLMDLISAERLPLKASLSRARNKFYRALSEDFEQFNKDRNEIIFQHTPRDKDGNYVWLDGEYGKLDIDTLDQEVKKQLEEDFHDLQLEYFEWADEKIEPILKKIFSSEELDLVPRNRYEDECLDILCDCLDLDI